MLTLEVPVHVRLQDLSLSALSLTFAIGKKTEEGWDIYKEDELGISQEGGGELEGLCHRYTTYSFEQTRQIVRLIVIAVSLSIDGLRPLTSS